MIADLELADKVGCHNGLVEILETGRSEVPTFRKPRKVGQPQLERVPAIEGRVGQPPISEGLSGDKTVPLKPKDGLNGTPAFRDSVVLDIHLFR